MKRAIFLTLIMILAAVSFSAAALEPANACIDEPYDYEYADDSLQVLINRYEEDGVTYFIADVQISEPSMFMTALSEDKVNGKKEDIDAMAYRNAAILAINADYFSFNKGGIIIRNGKLLRAAESRRHMLIVDANGDMSVVADRADENPLEFSRQLIDEGTLHTFEFGPELVRDGEIIEIDKNFSVTSINPVHRDPRTAIGQIGPLHYMIIVADGRQGGYSKGMTLGELQEIFVEHGAQTAMNLDGGGSSSIWFDGETVNKPSTGEERKMSDIIYF